MRSLTLACGGRVPPAELLRVMDFCVQLGANKVKFLGGGLSAKLCARVLRFVLPGGPALWRQVLAQTREEERVYFL
jgi:hypothetical protein